MKNHLMPPDQVQLMMPLARLAFDRNAVVSPKQVDQLRKLDRQHLGLLLLHSQKLIVDQLIQLAPELEDLDIMRREIDRTYTDFYKYSGRLGGRDDDDREYGDPIGGRDPEDDEIPAFRAGGHQPSSGVLSRLAARGVVAPPPPMSVSASDVRPDGEQTHTHGDDPPGDGQVLPSAVYGSAAEG